MSSSARRAFSFGWVIVSYFLVLGGIAAALVAAHALEVRDRNQAYGFIAGGAAIGGLFAGRASPHRSLLEPALAGALVVGSLLAFLSKTSVGDAIHAFTEDAMWREAAIVGGIALGGGLIGAIVGELSAPPEPSTSPLRWMGMAVLITAGALVACVVVSNVLLLDRALREGGALQVLVGKPLVTDDQLVRAFLVALAAAALIGGLVTQAAAPQRVVLAIGFAVLAGYAAMLLSVIDPRAADRDNLVGIASTSVAGALLAMVGAAVGRVVSRMAL